jgi:hypothetical protein
MPRAKRGAGYETDESGEEDSEVYEEEEVAEDMNFSSDDDKPLEERGNGSKSGDEDVDEDAEGDVDVEEGDEADELEVEAGPSVQNSPRPKRGGRGQQPRLKITLKIPAKLQSGSNSTEGTATPPITRPTRGRGSRGGRGGRRPALKKRISSHGLRITLLVWPFC